MNTLEPLAFLPQTEENIWEWERLLPERPEAAEQFTCWDLLGGTEGAAAIAPPGTRGQMRLAETEADGVATASSPPAAVRGEIWCWR